MRPSKMLHNSEILRVSKAKAPLRKAGIVHRPHARPEAKLAMIHAIAMSLRPDVFHCSKSEGFNCQAQSGPCNKTGSVNPSNHGFCGGSVQHFLKGQPQWPRSRRERLFARQVLIFSPCLLLCSLGAFYGVKGDWKFSLETGRCWSTPPKEVKAPLVMFFFVISKDVLNQPPA